MKWTLRILPILIILGLAWWILGPRAGEEEEAIEMPRPPFDFSSQPIAAAPEGAPNVVLISIDTLRADHLHCYGYDRETSPNLDALAAEGAVFEKAISSTSWTLPAHMALFTSLYDSVHGVQERDRRLAVEHPLLAEVLQESGYRTAGFYAGPFLHPGYGFGLGFDDYVNCTTFIIPEGQSVEEFRDDKKKADRASRFDITNPRIFDNVSTWFDNRMEEPFFLFIHYWDCHADYIPPEPYASRFDPDYQGDFDFHDVAHNEGIHPGMPPRDLHRLIALYDGEILWTDEWIGKLRKLMKDKGLLDRTLFVITSDHGDAFFEHGTKGHGDTLYDELIHVPLIVWWPGKIEAGQRIPEQVRLIDIYPTILDLVGLDPVPKILGQSLAERITGKVETVDLPPAVSELGYEKDEEHRPHLRSLRSPDWKIIETVLTGQSIYFDLKSDPGESSPIPGSDRADALRSLTEHVETLRIIRGSMKQTGDAQFDVDPEMLERLRALGYVK